MMFKNIIFLVWVFVLPITLFVYAYFTDVYSLFEAFNIAIGSVGGFFIGLLVERIDRGGSS